MKSPVLGVLGGLGPASSAYFYDMITAHTASECDSDHIDLVLASAASTPDRTGFILGNGEDPLPCMADCARRLEAFGADYIAIPCNTAHYFYDEIARSVGIPVINIIRETALYIKSLGISHIGLLATEGTVFSGAYAHVCRETGIDCTVPEKADRDILMDIIYGQIKAGKRADMDAFHAVSRRLTERGCERLILGCTELSLLKRDEGLDGALYTDSLEVLACRSIVLCGGRPIGFSDDLIKFEEERECSFRNC